MFLLFAVTIHEFTYISVAPWSHAGKYQLTSLALLLQTTIGFLEK